MEDTFLPTVNQFNFVVKPDSSMDVYINGLINESKTNQILNDKLWQLNIHLGSLNIAILKWNSALGKLGSKIHGVHEFTEAVTKTCKNIQLLQEKICKIFIKSETPCNFSTVLINILAI